MSLYLGGSAISSEGMPIVLDFNLHPEIRLIPPRGCKPRSKSISQICLHWTGGEGDVVQFRKVLHNRRVGAHFFIDRWGTIWQLADPLELQTYHAGRFVNPQSIGIEIACYGYRWPARKKWNWREVPKIARDRLIHQVKISNRDYYLADYYPVQTDAMISLVDELIAALPGIDRTVPLEPDGSLRTRRFSIREARSFSGVLGHLHVPMTGKIDPGPRPLDALRRHWKDS
jgi:hypothetical protein